VQPRSLLLTLFLPLAFVSLVAAGCGGSSAAPAAKLTTATKPKCPAAWAAGWQRLANRIGAPVYCPSWMPQPLDAKIGGDWFNGQYVSANGAYLVSFVWQETGPGGGEEVHVNFRGYPSQTAIPICPDTVVVGGKTLHPAKPCFSDARGHRLVPGIRATVYTANQGADQWHVLYAWRHEGSLYTLSEHVAPPFTYQRVVHNLDRMLKSLVLLQPPAQ
jgi:hypothetical protein